MTRGSFGLLLNVSGERNAGLGSNPRYSSSTNDQHTSRPDPHLRGALTSAQCPAAHSLDLPASWVTPAAEHSNFCDPQGATPVPKRVQRPPASIDPCPTTFIPQPCSIAPGDRVPSEAMAPRMVSLENDPAPCPNQAALRKRTLLTTTTTRSRLQLVFDLQAKPKLACL